MKNVLWKSYWESTVVPSFDALESRTVAEYVRLWNRELEPRIGSERIRDLDWRRAESVLNSIESPGIARSTYRLWKKIANMAVRDGIIERNPIDRTIRLPRIERAPKVLLDASELESWLGCIRGIKSEAALLMELGGGLRHSEACAMVWEYVAQANLGGRTYAAVRIERAIVDVPRKGKELKGTKTEASRRSILIGEPFSNRILELKRDFGAVSPNGESRKRREYSEKDFASPLAVSHRYREWVERRNGIYICPKNLRSTYAVWHGEAGSPDSLVSLSMGHSDGTTKGNHYQQGTARGYALIANRLAEYLSSPTDMDKDIESFFARVPKKEPGQRE